MKYKIGEKVVLENGVIAKVLEWHVIEDAYTVEGGDGSFKVNSIHIDHIKTAELNDPPMKYKAGDMVVLKNTYDIISRLNPVEIEKVQDGYYWSARFVDNKVDAKDIDDEKTAELNKRTLEDVITERNNTDYTKAIMKFGEDTVNHPSHYKQGGIETLDIIKAVTTGYSGYEGSLVANIVKYLARANFKGAKEEDIKKAQFYMNKLVEEVNRGC